MISMSSGFLRCPPPLALHGSVHGEGGLWKGYSLSMSLYFFRRMETWSLNKTGSILIWECISGMVPNQFANLFMHVWRWAKWSGSAHRDARELWGWGVGVTHKTRDLKKKKNEQCTIEYSEISRPIDRTLELLNPHCGILLSRKMCQKNIHVTK